MNLDVKNENVTDQFLALVRCIILYMGWLTRIVAMGFWVFQALEGRSEEQPYL